MEVSLRSKLNNLSDKSKVILKTILLTLLMTILFCNYLLKTDYLALFCTLIAVASIIFCDKKDFLPLLIVYSFFGYLFRFGGRELYYYILFIAIIRMLFLFPDKAIYMGILMVVYALFHVLSSYDVHFIWEHFLNMSNLFVLLTATMTYKFTNKRKCIDAYLYGFFLSSLLAFFKHFTRITTFLDVDYVTLNTWNDTIRFAGLSYDPNFYSILAVIALFIMLFYGDKLCKNFFVWLIISGLIFGFGLITFSKSLILCYGVVIIFAFIFAPKKNKLRMLYTLPVIVVLALIFHKKVWQLITLVASRFENIGSLDSLTTGRVTLWKNYINEIFASLPSALLGYGLEAPLVFGKAAHNIYLEILYKYGIVGLLFEAAFVVMCYKAMPKEQEFRIKNLIPALILAVMLFFLSACTFYSLWISIFMVMLLVRGGDDDDKVINSSTRL